ncbi:MAG: GntR family transcriptional regulator [Anaerolineales bacterium]|nr:GntR family transcriptional regulator [Anaerolineales bacterium]
MEASLSDQAYEILKAQILTCELRPGQQVAQNQLVEKLNVGKTPVREALQRLTQEGYVQPIPRFGFIVAPITLSDVHEIYEVRAILEPAIGRLAAVRATEEQLLRIKQAAEYTLASSKNDTTLEYLQRNVNFHVAIAAASGNQRLADQINKVMDELSRVLHLGLVLREKTEEMRRGHTKLVEALYDRDPDRVEEIMKKQIASSRQWFLDALTHYLGTSNQKAQIHLSDY